MHLYVHYRVSCCDFAPVCNDIFTNYFASTSYNQFKSLRIASVYISDSRLRRFIKNHANTLTAHGACRRHMAFNSSGSGGIRVRFTHARSDPIPVVFRSILIKFIREPEDIHCSNIFTTNSAKAFKNIQATIKSSSWVRADRNLACAWWGSAPDFPTVNSTQSNQLHQ